MDANFIRNGARMARRRRMPLAAAAALLLVAAFLLGGSGRVFAANSGDGSIGGLKAKFAQVDGIRTRYYEYGQGEPMVMIHGGFTANSSTANVFSRNIRGLAQHFHVFAVDRLASGLTGNPESDKDYSVQGDIDFIIAFIKAMNLGQVHLVGHSAGGGIALDLAIEHPEMVRTLTILAAGPEDPPEFSGPTKLTEMLKKCPDQSTYAGLKCRAGALAWLPDTFEEEYWKADEMMAMLPKTQRARAKLAAGAGQPVNGKEYQEWQKKMWDRARVDGVLQMPVLMVAGSDDVLDWPVNSPKATLQRELGLFHIVAAKDPRVEMIVINNGGHFMYREHPEEFNADLISFINFWEHHPKAPPISQGQFDKPFYQ
jgi:2-hydroxy-6-oxonona-2,4-dienedioate hydrolase